jgi:hypothetical protein
MAYLTVEEFKTIALIPASWVDELESMPGNSGFTAMQLDVGSDYIDSRLRKRYAAPFQVPVPGIIKQWLARLVTPDVLIKRGVNATDQQYEELVKKAVAADAQIMEAANSETGLFDLPLRNNTIASGILSGATRAYSEQSPYVWTDQQRATARHEDQSRRGSGNS